MKQNDGIKPRTAEEAEARRVSTLANERAGLYGPTTRTTYAPTWDGGATFPESDGALHSGHDTRSDEQRSLDRGPVRS